jgi:MFS family permease
VQALTSLAVGATSALLVVLATRHLRIGADGFGWLIAAIGVGALVGPFLSNWWTKGRYLDVRLLFVPYIIRGVGDVALGLVVGLPWALVILFVYGLNTSTGVVASNSILQTVIPDRVRGRVFALLDMTWAAMRLLSLGLGGVLADRIGISAVYVIGGSLLALAGLLGLVLLGQIPLAGADGAGPGGRGARWRGGRDDGPGAASWYAPSVVRGAYCPPAGRSSR